MKTKPTSSQGNNPEINPNWIMDHDLAEAMAYGEYDNRLLGLAAVRAGDYQKSMEHFDEADLASGVAGQAYIEELRQGLDDEAVRINFLQAELSSKTNLPKESLLSPEAELERKVEAAKKALFERYEKYGAKPEDFSLVSYEREDPETGAKSTVNVVMHAALSGLDLGNPAKTNDVKRSYNSLMDPSKGNEKAHTIEIDGVEQDTRTLDYPTYKAWINSLIDQASTLLPDSSQLEVWTFTHLPGEQADAASAYVGYVGGGQPDRGWVDRGDGDRVIRFRPAVVIE